MSRTSSTVRQRRLRSVTHAAMYAIGKDAASMKAVVGEEALAESEKLALEFLTKFGA